MMIVGEKRRVCESRLSTDRVRAELWLARVWSELFSHHPVCSWTQICVYCHIFVYFNSFNKRLTEYDIIPYIAIDVFVLATLYHFSNRVSGVYLFTCIIFIYFFSKQVPQYHSCQPIIGRCWSLGCLGQPALFAGRILWKATKLGFCNILLLVLAAVCVKYFILLTHMFILAVAAACRAACHPLADCTKQWNNGEFKLFISDICYIYCLYFCVPLNTTVV